MTPARSASASDERSGLIRTQSCERRDRCADRYSRTIPRAMGRFSAATASSRSRISASAPSASALASFFSLSPGTKSHARAAIARSLHQLRYTWPRRTWPRREPSMRNGIFLAPFHPVDEDPTLALRRDLELIEFLDEIGYEEAWIGEHHSAGYEIIASPELFIAAAAERTRRIKLGTGVISLPYHNPLMVADRMLQLDHMTMGRAMFGVGPGLLPSDAHMLGIPVAKQRDRMLESLEVILRLLAGETVTLKTEWF